jgi:hypothetical protein
MRFERFSLLAFLFVSALAWAQQPGTSQQATTLTPAPKDPRAVSVLSQALAVAGGTTALAAVMDYTATGTVTYPASQSPAITGTITISGRGLNQYRLDEVLPAGADSQIISGGGIAVKTQAGAVLQVPFPAPVMAGATTLPCLHVAALSSDSNVMLVYKGIVSQGGMSLHDILAVRVFPAQPDPPGPFLELGNAELFIDASTFQLVTAQDTLRGGAVRSIQYSNYRVVSGVAVPFVVTEQINSGVTRQIQLNQISFNTGVQISAFDLSH